MSCKTMNIDLANVPPVPIQIGVAGENAFRTITFDASTWGADFPDATYTVVYKRSDGYIYPVLVNAAADAIVWSPTGTDTAVSGNGQLEVRLLDGETIGKTIIMQTYVAPSLSGDESEPSTPAPDWVNDVTADADRAEAAVSHYPKIVNGVWFVWDATQSKFVSTGISAQGEDGFSPTVTVTAIEGGHRVTITDTDGAHTFDVMDGEGGSGGSETVIVTIDDTTDPMTASMNSTEIKAAVDAAKRVILRYDGSEIPYLIQADTISVFSTTVNFGTLTSVTILVSANATVDVLSTDIVQSVNGQTGAVVLGASDVHALPETYVAPVQSVNGKTGVVNLDASDVGALPDSTVIPAVPQMATAADMSDWTQGKTVDAAALKTDFIAASARLSNIVEVIDAHTNGIRDLRTNKADKTEIPTKTSDLTNDSGYQTAQDVQTAISGIQTHDPRIAKASTDTTVTLNPNTLYVFPEMASLTITLATPTGTGIVNEYHFVFTSGATATTLTIPATINQPDGFSVDANMVYEVSILENNMTAMSWEVSS